MVSGLVNSKTVDEKIKDVDFPKSTIEKLGNSCYLNGQKSFNGVAILTKGAAKLSSKILPGNDDDQQARFVEVYYKKKTNHRMPR